MQEWEQRLCSGTLEASSYGMYAAAIMVERSRFQPFWDFLPLPMSLFFILLTVAKPR